VESIVPFVLGLIVTAGVLVPLLLRSRDAVAESKQRAESLRKELEAQRRARTQLEADLGFLTTFLREFPLLSRGLYGGVKERELPRFFLEMVNRSLKPEHAVVLVRRRSAPPSGDAQPMLVVAAASPNSPLAIGSDVSPVQGEIGLVAEAQTTMNRADLASEEVASRLKPGAAPSVGSKFDLMAPMVFDQETLGIIALSGGGLGSPYAKAALQLIAQSGAQALSVAADYGRMKVSSQIDAMTGVYNKAHLTHVLSELIYTAACAAYDERGTGASGPRKLLAVSVFLFDVDHLKNYNELNGQLAGDKLLRQLAELVQKSIRSDDIFGRFGGGEFLLLLPNAPLSQAVPAAEKVRRVIAAYPFPNATRQPLGLVSISGGVAEYPFDGLDVDSLMKVAIDGVREAKRKGRNQVTARFRRDAAAQAASGEAPAGPAAGSGEDP